MQDQSYSLLDRQIHRMALSSRFARRGAFELELLLAQVLGRPKSEASSSSWLGHSGGPVFVCGLARSGTTVLLRALNRLESLHSLTYRDMPFVMAPGLWRMISGSSRRAMEATERAHGDDLLVDYDSPEAFEEVFWSTFEPGAAAQGCVGQQPPSDETLAAFRRYRELVANPPLQAVRAQPSTSRRYLSKNNNNLVRLTALCSEPSATVLLAYRHPLEVARSLHAQHQRFSALHARDAFGRSYMSWLGHFEFGLDHRPYCFARPGMNPALHPDAPDYWLDYWIAVHEHVLTLTHPAIHLVEHQALREQPRAMLTRVLRILDIATDQADGIWNEIKAPEARQGHESEPWHAGLVDQALHLHDRLRAASHNVRPEPTAR
jgi:hypothetical protein